MPCIKKTYPSKAQALKRARNLEVIEHKSLYAYKCSRCESWHLTSKKPPKRSYKQKHDGKRLR